MLGSTQVQKCTKGKRGFTLIELLVVIAIIAILASILFPVFARARENARRASCQSNLKQIGLGVMQYLQDYDEKYPMYRVGASGSAIRPYAWSDGIQPYVKSLQLLQCPSDSGVVNTTAPASTGFTDYGINLWIGGYTPTGTGGAAVKGSGLSQAALTQPSLTVLIAERPSNTADSYTAGYETYSSCYTSSPTVCQSLSTVPRSSVRHLDGINLAFADGHVKWYKANMAGTATNVSMSGVYALRAPASVSGNSPTFNPMP